MEQILHFSDTHDNQRAVEALLCVAANWKNACVAITGDVCSEVNKKASPKYNDLPNPDVWLVPGNHDTPIPSRLGHLNRVRWQTPYLVERSNSIVLGLNSEDIEGVEGQLRILDDGPKGSDEKVVIVLHHKPFNADLVEVLLSWACSASKIRSLVLLHGHEHPDETFFAEWSERKLDRVSILTSNLYSANTWFCHYGLAGCANLITIHDGGEVAIQTVYDPAETTTQDGFVERCSWGPRKPGWRFGRPGTKGGPPTYVLQNGDDPLVVIDEYWRWFVEYKSQ
jgi:predicted phosphodiesterase